MPKRIAPAPSAPRIWAVIGVSAPGMTSNQSRTIRKKDALTTRAERMALAGGGAPAWAGGSQRCRGKSAVLASSPTVISAAATMIGTGSVGAPLIRSASRAISRVA